MESSRACDFNILIDVLNQGKEQILELEAQLSQPCTVETCRALARQAQSSFAMAIVVTKLIQQRSKPAGSSLQLPAGLDKEQEKKEMSKKRKSLQQKWSSNVQVCVGSSMERSLDDGHNWRKYGQKDILGSIFPREYYRCSHRHSQGCQARKQVQRSNKDPYIIDITYSGTHTCIHADTRSEEQSYHQPKRTQTMKEIEQSNVSSITDQQVSSIHSASSSAATPPENLTMRTTDLEHNHFAMESMDIGLEYMEFYNDYFLLDFS
ncbi:hypothetical protein HPP92_000616 [Vanilla planifolia]|uniref:WRKY domain-containing protein n=1 Tax=Vanilla planifolia TaxID=51239 RepID=A0A835VG95_VANPL|nr:hypothetical protein HPP92_000616 [Vanilla planifolia]